MLTRSKTNPLPFSITFISNQRAISKTSRDRKFGVTTVLLVASRNPYYKPQISWPSFKALHETGKSCLCNLTSSALPRGTPSLVTCSTYRCSPVTWPTYMSPFHSFIPGLLLLLPAWPFLYAVLCLPYWILPGPTKVSSEAWDGQCLLLP